MAICKNCGTQNSGSASYCSNCGAVIQADPPATTGTSTPMTAVPQAPSTSQSASGRAIAALILGILSIVSSCGPVTGIIAIVLANQELRDIRNGMAPEAGKTLSQIGLWTGWIGTIACGLFWLAYIGVIIFAVSLGGLK